MSTEPTQRPIAVFRAGTIKAKVWRNENQKDGQTQVSHSVTFEKRYHDRNTDQWRDSASFFPDELPRLCLVVEQAYQYTTLRTEEGE